jgi:hypothetical protein
VFIDPVDSNRNVASALTKEKFDLFIKACKKYIKNPKVTFFFPKPLVHITEMPEGFHDIWFGMVEHSFKKVLRPDTPVERLLEKAYTIQADERVVHLRRRMLDLLPSGARSYPQALRQPQPHHIGPFPFILFGIHCVLQELSYLSVYLAHRCFFFPIGGCGKYYFVYDYLWVLRNL